MVTEQPLIIRCMTWDEIKKLEEDAQKEPEYLKTLHHNKLHDPVMEQFDDDVSEGLHYDISLEDTINAILYQDECGCR